MDRHAMQGLPPVTARGRRSSAICSGGGALRVPYLGSDEGLVKSPAFLPGTKNARPRFFAQSDPEVWDAIRLENQRQEDHVE